MVQSVEHETAERKVPGSSLRHSLLSDQNLGNGVSCERIGKKTKKKPEHSTSNSMPSVFSSKAPSNGLRFSHSKFLYLKSNQHFTSLSSVVKLSSMATSCLLVTITFDH